MNGITHDDGDETRRQISELKGEVRRLGDELRAVPRPPTVGWATNERVGLLNQRLKNLEERCHQPP